MTEILLFKPKMKLWLPIYYFIKREQGLLNIDVETKKQGLASCNWLWVSFGHHLLPPWPWDMIFFSCKCLKSHGGCAAASHWCFHSTKQKLQVCHVAVVESCAMVNCIWCSPVPGLPYGSSFPRNMPKQCLGECCLVHPHKPFKEQANNLNLWMISSSWAHSLGMPELS